MDRRYNTNGTTRMREEPSLGDLFQALSNDTGLLIRQEAALAKAEVQQKLDKLKENMVLFGAGAGLAIFAALSLLIALIWGLGALLDSIALSAFLIGLVFTGGAAFFIYRGIEKMKDFDPKPEQTIETLQEDKQWIQQQI